MDVLQPGRRQEKIAKQTAARQRAEIARQKQTEQRRLAEEESEVARRKAAATPGVAGRSLLIATSPTGIPKEKLG